ncbi:MAG: asparagine synthase (glutamine-hydrolyzing) [Gemmatimonadetes bacterium]|nr:MAG: asparagine synthase (glutamine-hydrolyzing) [Gemmatimonadota bacterium]
MCGIAGALTADTGRDVGPLITRLTAALVHRGPDGSGIHLACGRSIALGNRRLSIVDVAGGAQPMANEDERVWVVFNGELYNHLELRRELERLGHSFRTRADTEVLVHGWEQWGPGLLERLNGVYAFGVLDGRAGAPTLWLARDPIGVKPLYIGVTDGIWWFASELAAARGCGLLSADLRREAFDEYLVYRFVPSPGTFYRNAWKVPPGHLCRLSVAELPAAPPPAFVPFATRFAPASLPRSRGEWAEALRAGLAAAVRRQLMSDVPLGSLLSGGVDSTLITGMMRDALPEAPAAFAVGFTGNGSRGEELDELGAARRAAAVLGVPLTEVAIAEEDYLAAWPQQVAALGEPIANSGALMVGILCRTVRLTCKVVLAGQGADEPLGGYPRHVTERFYPLARLARPLLGRLPERLLSADRVARLRRVAGVSDEAGRFTETLAVFGVREAVALTRHQLDPGALAEPVRRWLPLDGGDDAVNRLLLVDARLSLADDLLIVADHMSMASSVELRVPFLDLEFLALVERMPSAYKISRLGERKWLYRRAVEPLLPGALRSVLTGWRARTGRKLGFSTPLERWFRTWLAQDAERFLLGTGAQTPDFLSGDAVRRLLTDARDRGLPRGRQLMSLYVLEGWLRGGEVTDGEARAHPARQ